MKRRITLYVFLCITYTGNVFAQTYMAADRKHLFPIPSFVRGINNPVQPMDDDWEINLKYTPEVVEDRSDGGQWRQVKVPGEAMMQGFVIKNDSAFVYRKKMFISSELKNYHHLIRFNGVYNHATVYCNGKKVREHFGGFTAWDADITAYVKYGQENWLHVVVTDRADDISYASGYAHHPIGGILRKVQHLLLPNNPVNYFYTDAGLTNQFKDGTLRIRMGMLQPANVKAEYELRDETGKKLWATPHLLQTVEGGFFEDSTVIKNIHAWTAETPHLYTIRLRILENGKLQQVIEQKLGFRTVQIDDQRQLLVNGNPVKLRGACRHDMHPLLGRSTNREQDSIDVRLAKDANLNFIRTSHYPPSTDFLEFCDRYGIYVQEETAICFVIEWREGIYKQYWATQDNPDFTGRYLGQLSEMIDHDRNHSSVIMWSIGNESKYGINFQKEYDFIKSADLSRPVSWSWPYTALEKGKRCFDIAVSHYPQYNGKGTDAGGIEKEMVHPQFPVIGDEWAHVACYNTDLLAYDPNIKNFWGISLDSMWMSRFDVKGNIGGAIWGMIDETFHLPDTITGYGPWGIVDVWRRKKPEFWNTKKAYSPVRLLLDQLRIENGNFFIPVHNRFDHLNLKDIHATIIRNDISSSLILPDVPAHGKGIIRVPAGENILILFKDKQGNMIDEEMIGTKKEYQVTIPQSKTNWVITQKDTLSFLVSGALTVTVNNRTGAIIKVTDGSRELINGNPVVSINKPKDAGVLKNTEGVFSGNYDIKTMSINQDNKNKVIINTKGIVDQYPVEMVTVLHASGWIEINYMVDSIPAYTWDIGIRIPVNPGFDQISWKRKAYWSVYPEGHLSSAEGIAYKNNPLPERYRSRPQGSTENAMYDYYINRTIEPQKARMPATENYRARKENIYSYTVSGNTGARLKVWSNGTQGAKMNVSNNGEQQLVVTDKNDYWSLSWGNYQGEINSPEKHTGKIILELLLF